MNAQAYQIPGETPRTAVHPPSLALHVTPVTRQQRAAIRRSRFHRFVALLFVTVVLTFAVAQAVQLRGLLQRTQAVAQEVSQLADLQSGRVPQSFSSVM